MIKVFISNSNTIILEGLKTLISDQDDIVLGGFGLTSKETFDQLKTNTPDIVIIDYTSEFFDLNDVKKIATLYPNIGLIGITDYNNSEMYQSAIEFGLKSHILNCCDQQELLDAIHAVYEGNEFYCGKVVDTLSENEDAKLSCAPVSLSDRELEIIALVAEGNTNKQIADTLFLSTHTVMTHRKNIMAKLGVSNTASIVMFAVKKRLVSPNKFLFAED